jgi:hypothetical protein
LIFGQKLTSAKVESAKMETTVHTTELLAMKNKSRLLSQTSEQSRRQAGFFRPGLA